MLFTNKSTSITPVVKAWLLIAKLNGSSGAGVEGRGISVQKVIVTSRAMSKATECNIQLSL